MPRRLPLQKDLRRHLLDGHPWIYSEALRAKGEPGEVVDVCDKAGTFLARGVLDPESPIAVRVISLHEDEPVEGLVERRLDEALALRERVIDRATTDAFRLLNGEGDHLPGVVVDVYGGVAVVRFDGAGPRAWAFESLVPALRARLPLATILERSSRGSDAKKLWGADPADEIAVREHGMTLLVDVKRGQKTGAFLDQRENRALVRTLANGRRVLNVFSYTGGFTLAAALGGATSTASVDLAGAALETAARTLKANGVEGSHTMEKADAYRWLRELPSGRFDLIVVDPPSMAPSEKTVARALDAYREINVSAMRALPDGGLLASASCSSHVDEPKFLAMLRDAASRAGRRTRVLTVRGAGADHPFAPGHPEGRYLKFVLLSVAR